MDNNIDVSIGKDVLESLTTSMYEDSRYVYREYVQNAADQIDKAKALGLLGEEDGEIHIHILPDQALVEIEDNATGIPQNEFINVLRNVAKSNKIKGKDKGFRGIGRLGGLGYCDELRFESSFHGEATKSILIWDAALLRRIIDDRSQKEEAAEVISRVTKFKKENEDVNMHYFKIIMKGVHDEVLLNIKEVRKYLSMVAPVAFPSHFVLGKKIYQAAREASFELDEYNLFINSEQLFKAYSTVIYDGEEGSMRRIDELFDVRCFEERDRNGKLIYWGWYGLNTTPNKQLSPANIARGIRLRKANIQVGNESTLVKLHRQERTNFYFFGEVHAVSEGLIPNSRRDYFSVGSEVSNFESKLKEFFHNELYKLSYEISKVSTLIKKVGEVEKHRKEFEQKEKDGAFADKRERQEYLERYEKKKKEAEAAKRKIERLGEEVASNPTSAADKVINKVLSTTEVRLDAKELDVAPIKAKNFRINKLRSLNKDQKALLGHVFSIIRDVLDKYKSEELISRIEEELK